MNPIINPIINHTNRHIRFDLSKNQTYIIENDSGYIDYDNIPFITILSSLLFITNTGLAYSKKYYVYAGFFLFLTITSLVYSLNTSIYSFIIDKIAILMVIAYGGYVLYKHSNSISKTYFAFIISTFVATIVLYYYGYKNGCFCFDTDYCIAENYMALVHIFSCIGHNMIIAI